MSVWQDIFAILTKRKIAVAPTTDSLADLIYAIEKRAMNSPVAGSLGHAARALEARAVDASVNSSAAWLLMQTWNQVNTYLASRADGTIYNQALRDLIANTLNATITSRASAADWTSALATKLNTNVDGQISQLPTTVAGGVWGAVTRTVTGIPSVVKSMQHFNNITTLTGNGATVTLSPSVTIAKAFILLRGGFPTAARLDFVGSPTSSQVIYNSTSVTSAASFSVVELN